MLVRGLVYPWVSAELKANLFIQYIQEREGEKKSIYLISICVVQLYYLSIMVEACDLDNREENHSIINYYYSLSLVCVCVVIFIFVTALIFRVSKRGMIRKKIKLETSFAHAYQAVVCKGHLSCSLVCAFLKYHKTDPNKWYYTENLIHQIQL